ncbi:MAG: 30S ribosomal protein S9 [bacterium]|nr:30S ribosomal protein S9 [bacterium]
MTAIKESAKGGSVSGGKKETTLKGEPRALAPKGDSRAPASLPSRERYIEAVGRRKTAVARVRLWKKVTASHGTPQDAVAGEITVNGRKYGEYFKTLRQRAAVVAPLSEVGMVNDVTIEGRLTGGGPNGQAEALRHGIARALVKMDEGQKPKLRRAGFMTRDPRMVERKKYGLKKARRAPQWSKR